MIDERAVEIWNDELEELFLRTGHRFRRVEPRRRMRDYIRGLLGPVGRKNGWQLADQHGSPVDEVVLPSTATMKLWAGHEVGSPAKSIWQAMAADAPSPSSSHQGSGAMPRS